MHKKLGVAIIICIAGIAAVGIWHFAPRPIKQKPAEPNRPSTESVVTFKDDQAKDKFIRDHNLDDKDLHQSKLGSNTYVAPVTSSKPTTLADGSTIAPRRKYRALLTPNDPLYPQTYTSKISAPSAWDVTTGSSSVIIADIDTGFALSHQDLANRWFVNSGEYGAGKESNGIDDDGDGKVDDWRGWDFIHNDNNPNAGSSSPTGDAVSHGTITAGLIGATGNNGIGSASVNWTATILPLQVLDDDGLGFTDDVAAAIDYATAHGATVINMSLGTDATDPIVETAVTNAVNAGVTVVAAAGNCGDPASYTANGCTNVGQISYPAKYSNVIAVGATTDSDSRASFSSYGPEVDIVAPGAGAIKAPAWSQSNQTTSYSGSAFGTSFSSPIVAGTVGLMKSLQSSLSPAQAANALRHGVDKIGEMNGSDRTDYDGYGRLNVWKAVKFTASAHADGALIRADGSPDVYLIENGQRRYIGLPQVLVSQGFGSTKVLTATIADQYLPTGNGLYFREGTLLKGSGPNVYIVAYSGATPTKRLIASATIFNALGFSAADIQTVNNNELPATDGSMISDATIHPDGTLVKDSVGNVYLLQGGQRRYVGSPQVLQSYHFASAKAATSGDLALTSGATLSFREGTLVKDASPAIYSIDDVSGSLQKRHIATADIFGLLEYNTAATDILTIPTDALPTQNAAAVQ